MEQDKLEKNKHLHVSIEQCDIDSLSAYHIMLLCYKRHPNLSILSGLPICLSGSSGSQSFLHVHVYMQCLFQVEQIHVYHVWYTYPLIKSRQLHVQCSCLDVELIYMQIIVLLKQDRSTTQKWLLTNTASLQRNRATKNENHLLLSTARRETFEGENFGGSVGSKHFAEKTLAGGSQTAEFVKVFSLKTFPL